MRRTMLLAYIIISMYVPCVAQDYGTQYNRTPLPPNTAALFKPWDKPIGTFTGIPPISIPLYTLENNGLSVPISLSYSAGGIKVEEIASSVGLGWNLSAGGMVSRIKNGRADDQQGQWFSEYKPSHFTGTYEQLEGVINGADDLEPDIFMYNVNGMSGTFIVDETENIVLLEKSSDVKIEPWFFTYLGSPYLGGFILTDERGYKYKFGTNDLNTTEFYVSGWHLDEITDLNGQQVAAFQYVSSIHSYTTWTSAFVTNLFGSYNFSGCTPSDYAGGENQSLQVTYEHHLNKVYMGDDTVVFHLSSRLDLYGSYKVDRMEVKHKTTVVSKFNFNYDYFMTAWYTPSTEENNERNMRLRLKNISQQPVTGTDSLTHSFTYNTDQAFPERLSKGVDYWGYFNGAYGNASLVPNGIYSTMASLVGLNGYGERRTNHDYTATGTLTRITFPTGGYRQFEYEGNQILYNLPYYPDDLYPDLNDHTGQWFEGYEFDNYDPIMSPAYEEVFTINSLNGSAFFNFWIDGWASWIRVKIIKTSNGAILADLEDEFDGSVLLPNGEYRVEVYYDYYGSVYALYADWQEMNTLNYNTPRDVGGLRIKRIDDYDPVSNKHHYTRYKYYYPSDTTVTSGVLVSVPVVLFKSSCPGKNCDLVRISSSSNYPLSTEGGSYVVYTHVRVIEDGNGYTDRVYQMASDYEYPFEFPVIPPIKRSYARGQLLSTRYYNQAGALIRFDTTAYLEPEESWAPNAISIRVAVHDVTDPYPQRIHCTSSRYFMKAIAARPKFERTVWYSPSGSHETETSYLYYDSLGKKHLKQVSTKQSDGSTKLAYYCYPFNGNTAFRLPLSAAEKSMKDALLASNYLGPLEEVTYSKKGNDSVLITGTKTSFGYFHTTNKHPATVKQFTTLSDSSTFNFSVYDAYGNVQEQYVSNNVKEVYLYGYDHKYVVAKITGSDYSTVSGISFNNSILQNPADDATLRTELNKIRTVLAGSKAQVFTYTYKPLTGVTSITDANGKTVYYEYDAHGRLMHIRDHQQNILQKFSYSITQ